MKNKKIICVFSIILVFIIVGILIYIYFIEEQNKPKEIFKDYISYLQAQEYEKMYELINEESKKKINKEDFITRNKNIYEGIEASNIEVTIGETQKENGKIKIPYNMKMNTVAGKLEFNYQIELSKENKEYLIRMVF